MGMPTIWTNVVKTQVGSNARFTFPETSLSATCAVTDKKMGMVSRYQGQRESLDTEPQSPESPTRKYTNSPPPSTSNKGGDPVNFADKMNAMKLT